MTNPFEDHGREYEALVNAAGQHSLWPVDIEVPDGWTVTFGPGGRAECLEFIENNWSDVRLFRRGAESAG